MSKINKKLEYLYTDENKIVWMEAFDKSFSCDLPSIYHWNNRSFHINEQCDDIQVVIEDDKLSFFLMNTADSKVLYVETAQADGGFEIQDVCILNVVKEQ